MSNKKFKINICLLTESYQSIEKYITKNKRQIEISAHTYIKILKIKHIGDRTEIKINIDNLINFHTFLVQKKIKSWKKSFIDDDNDMSDLFQFILKTNDIKFIDYLINNNFLCDADHQFINDIYDGFMINACNLSDASTIAHLISKNKISVELSEHLFYSAIRRQNIDIIELLLEKIKYSKKFLSLLVKNASKKGEIHIAEPLLRVIKKHVSHQTNELLR